MRAHTLTHRYTYGFMTISNNIAKENKQAQNNIVLVIGKYQLQYIYANMYNLHLAIINKYI